MRILFFALITQPEFIASIRASSPVAPRNEAILRSLQDVADLPTADGQTVGSIDSSDLALAFKILAAPRPEDAQARGTISPHCSTQEAADAGAVAAIAARRKTCADIAKAIATYPGVGHLDGRISGALPWFLAQQQAWIASVDPRLAAMAATARREAEELCAAV